MLELEPGRKVQFRSAIQHLVNGQHWCNEHTLAPMSPATLARTIVSW
jgi:hypothetical protein